MIQCQSIARQDELQGNLFPAKQYKDIGTFLTVANQLKGPQKSETQESLLPLFGVCFVRRVAFCNESNAFSNGVLASSLSPSIFLHKSPGYDFNEIEDTLPSLQVTCWIPEDWFQGNATPELKYEAAAQLWQGRLHKCHQKVNHCLSLTGSVSIFLFRKATQQWRLSLTSCRNNSTTGHRSGLLTPFFLYD